MIALMIYFPVGYLTYNQIGIWKSGIDLWTYVIKKEPEKILFAYYNRGGLFAKKGMYLEAIDDYSMVIARNYEEYSKVYIHRGLVYSQAGNLGAAVADFEKACQLGDAFGCSALKMYRTR
jgi:tetratricopeptide (TPR) repeat protein